MSDIEKMTRYHLATGYVFYEQEDGSMVPRTIENFMNGAIPIEELDDDELHKCAVKGADGRFKRYKNTLPRAFVQSISREVQRRYMLRYQGVIPDAQQVFIDVMLDPNADVKDRMKASQYIQERMFGKPVERVEVTAEVKPWEGLVADIVHDIENEPVDSEGPSVVE